MTYKYFSTGLSNFLYLNVIHEKVIIIHLLLMSIC